MVGCGHKFYFVYGERYALFSVRGCGKPLARTLLYIIVVFGKGFIILWQDL